MKFSLLHYRLQPVALRLRLIRWFRELAIVGAATAAAAFGLAWILAGNPSARLAVGCLAGLGFAAAVWRTVIRWVAPDDFEGAARAVEARHPDLRGMLKTAVLQRPDDSGRFHFLQQHLIDEAITHGVRHPWPGTVSIWRVLGWMALPLVAVWLTSLSLSLSPSGRRSIASRGLVLKLPATGVEVTPGDVVQERGTSLVVLARFGKVPPQGAELVLTASGEPERRISLVRSLTDPVFGGRVAELSKDLTYRLEYGGTKTRDFSVKLYDLPRLERADVTVEFPSYTALPPREVRDTRRISAVEGARMSWQFLLNKPVRSASLVSRGSVSNRIELSTLAGTATLAWTNALVTTNVTYELRLVDSEGRTNKVAPQLVIEALPNRTPELKLASPRGDQHPSPLEEITFDGTVWDDFGVRAFGIAVTRPGSETQWIEWGRDVPGREKKAFKYVLRLEELGVKPDQLLAWFVWMDDTGPDGAVRRTTGDLYFAEVRPFDEVFREAQGGGGEESEGGGGGGGGQGGDPGGKLADLQKQVIHATWKLQRERSERSPGKPGAIRSDSQPTPSPRTSSRIPAAASPGQAIAIGNAATVFGQVAPTPETTNRRRTATESRRGAGTNSPAASPIPRGGAGRFEDDLQAVREGAEQALEQARESMEKAQNPETRTLWQTAIRAMERSLDSLGKSLKTPQALAEALVDEQAAYQTLLQLRARETEVTRGRNRSRGQGQGGAANQRQIDQLDLAQSENRYETQRSAPSPQTAERRAQLQILSRLQELARRQQDVNERLKELQTALQEARTPQEREELQRRLKRLQEEQQQMLSDVDEVQQRMNRPEAQSQSSQSRQELDQARQDLQKAAEATGEGRVSQALASGSRAEQKLEKMRDELRRESSNAFSEELHQLRTEARELQRREEDIARQLRNQGESQEKRLADSGEANRKLMQQLAEQKRSITNLVERATQISQQSEASEPLLSRQLYDTLRSFQQQDPVSVSRVQEQLLQSGELTRGLNERLQQISANDSARAVEATAELIRQGLGARAGVAEQEARKGIETLKSGVERAASRVLGDDTEALRLAGEELDSLSGELEREISEARGRDPAAPKELEAGKNPSGAGTARGNRNRESKTSDEQPTSTNASSSEPSGSVASSNPSSRSPGQGGGRGQGPGQDREPGTERDPSTPARPESGQASAPGQGRSPGQNSSQAQEQSQSESDSQSQGQAQGEGQGQGQARRGNGGRNPGQNGRGEGNASATRGGRSTNGGDARGGDVDLSGFAGADTQRGGGAGGGGGRGGPLTGADFAPWADRLRDAEDLVDLPELRSGIATARERARLARLEYRREGKKPDWAVVELQVLKPLVEVRRQIREELGRRNTQDPLAPIDRDAVPPRFAEQVQRYYETLGRDAKSGDSGKGKEP